MVLEIGGAVWLQTVLSLIRDMLFHLEIFEYLGEAETTHTCNSLDQSFSTWALLMFWIRSFIIVLSALCIVDCLVPASNTLRVVVTIRNVFMYCQNPPWGRGQIVPVGNHCPRALHFF